MSSDSGDRVFIRLCFADRTRNALILFTSSGVKCRSEEMKTYKEEVFPFFTL